MTEIEQILVGNTNIRPDSVAETHLCDTLCNAAETYRPGCDYIPALYSLAHIFEIEHKLRGVGSEITFRSMTHDIDTISGCLEFRADDLSGIHSSRRESDQRRRHIDVVERTAHGVFSSDCRETERQLHLQRAEKRGKRLAP